MPNSEPDNATAFGPVLSVYVAAKDMLRSGRIEPPTLRTFNLTAT